jgi:glutathione S-transferase
MSPDGEMRGRSTFPPILVGAARGSRMGDNGMLVIHHLRQSQSERIIWLCEELALPYELKVYDREATGAAPPAYKALHAFGTAPVIQDGDLVLGESGAIIEYLCQQHAQGRLTVTAGAANFAQYLYWLHFGNSSFLPAVMMAMAPATPIPGMDPAERERMRRHRFDRAFALAEQRLGEAPFFAGPELTAADIMMLFPLARTRTAVPKDIAEFPNIRAYLERISARPAFQRAAQNGDPGRSSNLI